MRGRYQFLWAVVFVALMTGFATDATAAAKKKARPAPRKKATPRPARIVAQPVNPVALRAAITDLAREFPREYPGAGEYLRRLDQLTSAGDAAKGLEALQIEALGAAHPLLRGRELLFVERRQYVPDHHNTETMFQTGETNTRSFTPGGALKAIDLSTGRVRTLLETREGLIRDPEVHFGGKKIVFSMRRNINEDYKIFEIGSDGSGLKQLTFAPGVFDIDPFYLPDDTIAFSSSREPKYCMCNIHIMANLYRMEADGANIRQIGKNTLFEGHGSLLPDGRILYDRWEYVDRNFGDAQGLWTANPDGTNHAVYWGNNTASPGGVIDARTIPGSQQVIAVLGSCHDRPWGALGIIDRRIGLDGRAPIVRSWPPSAADLATTTGNNLFDRYKQILPKYEDPFPLAAADGRGAGKWFLCSRMTGEGEKMGIYLVDVFGNEVLLHTEGEGCFDPMPLESHPRPPRVVERSDFASAEGTFYVQDVYLGTAMQGVPLGTVKALRVVEEPEKRQWTNPAWGGQGVERPAMNWHDFNSKRILGTVPVEADGSAYFKAPAGRFLYFQLLDEKGMMVQSMRSGAILQPGERSGCVGCHEERRSTPPAAGKAKPLALRRAPSALAPWHGPERNFNYLAEVQPVFDKYCVRCHDYGKPLGKKLNLSGDRDLVFNTSYNELWRKGLTGGIGAGPPQIQPPGAWGSRASRLVKAVLAGRQKYRMTDEDVDRIITWVDLNAPYYPDYASAWPDGLAGRAPLDSKSQARLAELTGINLNKWASHNGNTGTLVSFERPELSPCLAGLKEKDPAKYAEALAIIKTGAHALVARPNPDKPGFQACPTDQRREAKYESLAAFEAQSRQAILDGRKIYDAGAK